MCIQKQQKRKRDFQLTYFESTCTLAQLHHFQCVSGACCSRGCARSSPLSREHPFFAFFVARNVFSGCLLKYKIITKKYTLGYFLKISLLVFPHYISQVTHTCWTKTGHSTLNSLTAHELVARKILQCLVRNYTITDAM